ADTGAASVTAVGEGKARAGAAIAQPRALPGSEPRSPPGGLAQAAFQGIARDSGAAPSQGAAHQTEPEIGNSSRGGLLRRAGNLTQKFASTWGPVIGAKFELLASG